LTRGIALTTVYALTCYTVIACSAQCQLLTSITWAVTLNWLESASSHPLFPAVDFDP